MPSHRPVQRHSGVSWLTSERTCNGHLLDKLDLRHTFPRMHRYAEPGKLPGSQRCCVHTDVDLLQQNIRYHKYTYSWWYTNIKRFKFSSTCDSEDLNNTVTHQPMCSRPICSQQSNHYGLATYRRVLTTDWSGLVGLAGLYIHVCLTDLRTHSLHEMAHSLITGIDVLALSA